MHIEIDALHVSSSLSVFVLYSCQTSFLHRKLAIQALHAGLLNPDSYLHSIYIEEVLTNIDP